MNFEKNDTFYHFFRTNSLYLIYSMKKDFIQYLTGAAIFFLVYLAPVCPDCSEADCIYQAIESRIQCEDDKCIKDVIHEVAKERNLNSKQIETLLKEYYL